MPNSRATTKLAIASLTGEKLPLFVPRLIADDTANLVRECLHQQSSIKTLKVSDKAASQLNKGRKLYRTPEGDCRYTISQYLLLVVCSAIATESLIKKHNSGKISDAEFIEAIKGNENAKRKTKSSRKVGGAKMETNGGDRAVDADKV